MTDFLVLTNQILASFTLILAFSLLVFIIAYNRKSAIGRAFAIMLVCVCFTYAGDVAIFQVQDWDDAVPWLKFQWIGIAFTPAAYLHFSDALLRTTNAFSKIRRLAVWSAYALGAVFLELAIFSNVLVEDGFFTPGITQFQAGPLFWLFTIYFFAAVFWGFANTQRARERCLTSASRRRMTYLMVSFAAPAFGVFPYLLVAASQPSLIAPLWLLGILVFFNLGIDLMLLFMAYSVAFFDAFTPDRVVKYVLVTYLLRGVLVASLVIMVILALPDQDVIWGLPRDAILMAAIVAIIILAQIVAPALKPVIGRLVYRNDVTEVNLLRQIDSRLLTTTDLRQALENVLTTLCELLRIETGFVANVAAQQGPRLEASTGSAEDIEQALSNFNAQILNQSEAEQVNDIFTQYENFWYVALRTRDRQHYLGLLGVKAGPTKMDLSPHEERTVQILIRQAEFVLEDRYLQQNVFKALHSIMPEMERAQRVRNAVPYQGSPVEQLILDDSPVNQPDFPKLVHEALAHYWGGPKLTNSPLMDLIIVRGAMEAEDGNSVKALRSVLTQAIEGIKPSGERRMTASEWLFYNILELKFIQGLKVRDVARRLAMSESDLYRKQKLAIETVAQILSEMEQQETTSSTLPQNNGSTQLGLSASDVLKGDSQ